MTGSASPPVRGFPPVDHLVYSVPDLESGVAAVEGLLGVRAQMGGQHLGRGSHNALLGLGEGMYLEIVAPDPDQPPPPRPRWFSLDTITSPRLFTWAMKSSRLHERWQEAFTQGISFGRVSTGTRTRMDGSTLSWEFTDPATVLCDGVVPFLIDWGDSPHPADSAPGGATLLSFRAEHPDPEIVAGILRATGESLSVTRGPIPALVARIQTSRGQVELR
jgi:hypothetical protein